MLEEEDWARIVSFMQTHGIEVEERPTKRAADFAAECAYDEPCKQCIHPVCKNYAKRQNR